METTSCLRKKQPCCGVFVVGLMVDWWVVSLVMGLIRLCERSSGSVSAEKMEMEETSIGQ